MYDIAVLTSYGVWQKHQKVMDWRITEGVLYILVAGKNKPYSAFTYAEGYWFKIETEEV